MVSISRNGAERNEGLIHRTERIECTTDQSKTTVYIARKELRGTRYGQLAHLTTFIWTCSQTLRSREHYRRTSRSVYFNSVRANAKFDCRLKRSSQWHGIIRISVKLCPNLKNRPDICRAPALLNLCSCQRIQVDDSPRISNGLYGIYRLSICLRLITGKGYRATLGWWIRNDD